MKRRLALQAFSALAAAPLARAGDDTLAAVQARGALTVAVYRDMPPFADAGGGIDVDLAQALAGELGTRLALLPFTAGDDVADDLRNMVWKGHYLGYGPADVLMHVPVDAPLMAANPQVRVFAPYWHDRVMLARRLDRLPALESLAGLSGGRVAVAGDTLAGWLLLGAEGGALREQLATTFGNGVEAARALARDPSLAAAAGLGSELESVLGGDPRYAIAPLPMPHAARSGWAVGLAVKKDAATLAEALQKAMDALVADGRMQRLFARAHVTWHGA